MLYEAGGWVVVLAEMLKVSCLGGRKICVSSWDTEEGPPPDKSEHMAPKEHPSGEDIRPG